MADTILTLDQLESIFYNLTCQLLGLNPEDPNNFGKVRVSWQKDGTPGWAITDDIAFLRISTLNDPYTQQRDTVYTGGNSGESNVITSYTRVHSIQWIIYGPNSYENANLLRNGLFKSDLSLNNLFLVLDVPVPIRSPELFNGRWWERSDFSVRFNEKAILQGTVPVIQGVNIQIKTEEGVTENVNITS
ncbi:hypothetical protein REC12_11490 [Desulfosporosinus sp. PR]|nr:hypothetical protein [Desulfosporosinus sp. PR]